MAGSAICGLKMCVWTVWSEISIDFAFDSWSANLNQQVTFITIYQTNTKGGGHKLFLAEGELKDLIDIIMCHVCRMYHHYFAVSEQ